MLADARQIHHEHLLELHSHGFLNAGHIRIQQPGVVGACQIVFPVRPPVQFHIFPGYLRLRPRDRLVLPFRTLLQLLIVVIPRLIIIIDRRLIRVMENIHQPLGAAAGAKLQLPVLSTQPPLQRS